LRKELPGGPRGQVRGEKRDKKGAPIGGDLVPLSFKGDPQKGLLEGVLKKIGPEKPRRALRSPV